MSLEEMKASFLKAMQEEEIIHEPQHNAFEVEDTVYHTNYAFHLDGDKVFLYDTSRGRGNILVFTFGPEVFPVDCVTAKDYYQFVYQKAMRCVDGVCFFCYINPETFEPIEE